MSQVAIRAALETALAAMTPELVTAFENAKFTPPVVTTPYQMAHVLFATPDNREAGRAYQELGYMQVTLKYPPNAGTANAATRALLLQQTFRKGTTLSSGGINVVIDKTPAIGNGTVDVDRWSLPVKIPFHADIT